MRYSVHIGREFRSVPAPVRKRLRSKLADISEVLEGLGARSPIMDTLALLWLQGRIVPAGRVGSGRRWALVDAWFRTPLGPIPERPVALRQAAIRSLRALGVATQLQVKRHFIRHRYQGLASAWRDLETSGQIVPVELGLKGDWYVHADDLGLLEQIESGAFEPRTTLLSPFDNLICDRDRTLALASLGVFMTALDTLVVANSLPALRASLHANLGDLEWTVNAYNLSFAVALLTGAALGDRALVLKRI